VRRLLRAVVYSISVWPTAAWPQQGPLADPWLAKPVDDQSFRTYLDFFKYDDRVPFDTRIIETSELEGIRKEHLSFQSTSGIRVFANFFCVSGTDSPRPAMILLHGGGAPGKDAAGMNRLAALLARADWNALVIDMPYFGERSTDLLTTFTEQDKHDRLYNQPPVYLAWVVQTIKDIGRSYDFLVGQRGVDPKRVGVFGFSRGAMIAAIAGGADRRLAAVVMSYGGHFDASEREHLPAACPANYIGRISPRPLLMLNGKFDTDMIPDTSVEPLYGLARPPKQILWSEGGHAAPSEENQAAMLKWLRENLK